MNSFSELRVKDLVHERPCMLRLVFCTFEIHACSIYIGIPFWGD